jgi:hypothetical protein
MTVQTVEDHIRAEWNWLKAAIATHPYLSVLGALVVGGVIGHFV